MPTTTIRTEDDLKERVGAAVSSEDMARWVLARVRGEKAAKPRSRRVLP